MHAQTCEIDTSTQHANNATNVDSCNISLAPQLATATPAIDTVQQRTQPTDLELRTQEISPHRNISDAPDNSNGTINTFHGHDRDDGPYLASVEQVFEDAPLLQG